MALRIAVVTRYLHQAGGIETYLSSVLPELVSRGHVVGVWHEAPLAPGDREFLPTTIAAFPISASGSETMTRLSDWNANIVFLHGLSSPDLESRFANGAPLVRFLHTYSGSCISGTKTHMYPTPRPCSRTFGTGCLLQYYPRHCGGWHPITMVTSYRSQRRQQALLTGATFVTTLSEHMRQESIAHGVEPAHAIRLPAFAPSESVCPESAERSGVPSFDTGAWHLLFAGRLESLKGADLLIDALRHLQRPLGRRLRVTVAGDGRERARLLRLASTLGRPDIDVQFVGWLTPAERTRVLTTVDLLVVPSVWPEPLGLIGLEAGAAGVPAVAFDVGGIHEWLTDGVTGRLVKAMPPSSAHLAAAIDDCLSDPARLRSWAAAAVAASRQRTLGSHVDALETVLFRAANQSPVHDGLTPSPSVLASA